MRFRVWIARLKNISRAAMTRTRLLGMVYVTFCNRLAVKPSVVLLESHQGIEFFGSPYYMARYILRCDQYQHLQVVVVCPRRAVKKLRRGFAAQTVRFCRPRSIWYAFHLATAGFLVNDVAFPLYFSRRAGQQYLNTWHGTPLKALGRQSAQGNLEFVSNPQRNLLHATDLLAPNRHTERVLLRDYMIQGIWTGNILRCGYPRNDVLVLSANPSAGQQDCKWNIAFMPTWRASRANLAEASLEHLYGLRELFALLDENLPHTMTVWVRLHPLLRSAQYLRSYRRIRPFPEDIEPYKHLATCDALVTDYSSVLFDFAATRRPIFLYTPDEGAYRKERDFCLDIDTLPFQRFATPSELLESLAGLADCLPQASVAYQDFIAEYANLDCGQSAEALCSQFFLRRTSIETIKFLPDPRRRTLLIYCGSLLNNGITASLKTLVSLVDKQLYNIVLWFDVVPAVTNAADYIRQLGQDVAYIPTNSVLMVSQNEGMRLLLREITGVRRIFTGPRSQELWKREWCRLFATAHFDAVVHFSGYERRVSHLLSICPARRIIFVHNEMTEEVEKKGIDQEALETAYEKADVIAMVREGLDQKYNSRVSDTSARSMFIPNTLRTNYGELSSAPLLNSLATDGDQGMASKLECMVGQQGAFRFLNLARFAVEKGQERLIDAFERLWADSPRSQLFMLGGYGATYRQLSRRVQSSPASESIFIGLGSDNPYPLVVRMDTMVLASYYEGRPLVLYEAFALGLSVLSTDIPGPAEILNQGYGLVVENSIEGLVEGMRAALRGEIPIRDYDIEAHNRFALSQFYKAVGD